MSHDPPVIALLDSYSGSNLGDAAILDATIAHLRARLPGATLTAVSMNVENMQRRHGVPGVELCCTSLRYYAMSLPSALVPRAEGTAAGPRGAFRRMKEAVKRRVPRLWSLMARVRFVCASLPREAAHFRMAVRYLRSHTLLLIAGGGQFDDEWGGPWGHPYALFKWAVAARLAGIPTAIASVGVCKLEHFWSKILLSRVLRLAAYRSYRDAFSRDVAATLFAPAKDDAVVPDLALALPASAVPPANDIRERARGRRVLAVSPIAYKRPGIWPAEDRQAYSRYLVEMSRLIVRLVEEGDFVLFVWSSMPDDRVTLDEILHRLDAAELARVRDSSMIATIENWPDVLANMQSADVIVASRLHSVVLSLVVHKPVIAISFDAKVDRIMQELRKDTYLLNIHDFGVDDVIERLERLRNDGDSYRFDIDEFMERAVANSHAQFDVIAELARSRCARRTDAANVS